ncbi:MAG: hypothetical protein ABMB14_34730, partial [Myxococcota bacterium]
MARTLLVLVSLASTLALGCNPKTAPEGGTDEAADKPVPAEPAPTEPTPAPVPVATPQGLYDECRERVENPQKDDECKADADCATAGCGNEVCTTGGEKANVMTTCEDKQCFKVLETCGCHEGECTWTLKSEVPA